MSPALSSFALLFSCRLLQMRFAQILFLHRPNMLTKLLLLIGLALAFLTQILCQAGFWALPGCQLDCIFNVLEKEDLLGCSLTDEYGNPDIGCLCSKPDFEYGVRDCILESCPPASGDFVNAYLQVCGRQFLGLDSCILNVVADLVSRRYEHSSVYHAFHFDYAKLGDDAQFGVGGDDIE